MKIDGRPFIRATFSSSVSCVGLEGMVWGYNVVMQQEIEILSRVVVLYGPHMKNGLGPISSPRRTISWGLPDWLNRLPAGYKFL